MVVAHDREGAARLVGEMIESMTGRPIRDVAIGNDEYSLNSVNGRASFHDGETVFFKFHVEEGESDRVGEYYRAKVLSDRGLPVDVPLAISADPGEQIVLYEVRDAPRMSDVCLELEVASGQHASLNSDLITARRTLDAAIGAVLVDTIHVPIEQQRAPAAIHQLFTNRMIDADGRYPGGRMLDWYSSSSEWAFLGDSQWELNGLRYPCSLDELAREALDRLNPERFQNGPCVVAHGDDHHGNVWVLAGTGGSELRLFDPAFAGDDIPALLALVKSTFHNVFAHPYWIYHPSRISASGVHVEFRDAEISVVDPFAVLSPLRRQVLDSIVELGWIPLVRELRARGLLDPEWRAIVRSALFLCPFLVTNLLSPDRSEAARYVALAHAVMMGCEPETGSDVVSTMLDTIETGAVR